MKKPKKGKKLYKIDDKKRITLPEDILEKYDLEIGDYVKFELVNGKVELKKISIPS